MGDHEENKIKYREIFAKFTNKKVVNVAILVILVLLLIWSTSIRTQNVPLLKDSTSGEYIPLALDPYYFLRLANTLVEEGGLPDQDDMRYLKVGVPFTKEILPNVIVSIYKIGKIILPSMSVAEADIFYPVIFFVIGMIIFFFMAYLLTKSKIAALLSSIFLGFIPPYLYRTMAGFADHEAIGMAAFFFVIAILALIFKLHQEKKLNSTKIAISAGTILGIFSSFTLRSWHGIAVFIFMVVPMSFAIWWITKTKNLESDSPKKFCSIIFIYFSWVISTVIMEAIFGMPPINTIKGNFFGVSGIITPFLLLFLPIDYYLARNRNKFFKKSLHSYRIIISGIITLILGGVVYSIFIGNLGSEISRILGRLIHPYGSGRTGLTVAENKQPYLVDWFSQIGKNFFWLFFLGVIFVGLNISKGIRGNKYKIAFVISWVILISSILFGRISAQSTMNGENIISQFFLYFGMIIFLVCIIWIFFKSEYNLKNNLIVMVSILIPMLIATRSAIRLFFVIVPFISLMASYLLVNLLEYSKKSKEEMVRLFFIAGAIIVAIIMIISLVGFINTSGSQAKYTGPSANQQWQKAMEWVRTNTSERSVFVHWWDYGYWVQTLGERPTVTDGGHAIGFWDHLTGRYLLTTPHPETALSFMKSHDVSYLLIDPTDIGKYPAYSKIGSDEGGTDRYSWISAMLVDPKQTQETRNGTLKVYVGSVPLDEDLVYDNNGSQIFLPAGRAGVGAVIFESVGNENEVQFKQPQAVYIYNGAQYRIPLRYLEFDGGFTDFGSGIEATVKFIPSVSTSGQSLQIDPIGAALYLSPRVSGSLFAQLYLMNDPQGMYPTLNLSHSEPDPMISSLNAQGAGLSEFVYYQGIRGPIKIWHVDYPNNIISREEFLRKSGKYAELDNLEFAR